MKKLFLVLAVVVLVCALVFPFAGCRGETGAMGETGVGVTGATGPVGPIGAIGATGPQGAKGISINWLGAFTKAPNNPNLNDAYYNKVKGISFIWDGDSWEILAKDGSSGWGATGATGEQGLQGAQGVTGETGETGATGAQGPQGDTGEQGIQGIQGIPGTAGIAGTNGVDGADGAPGAPGACSCNIQAGSCVVSGCGSWMATVTFDTPFGAAPYVLVSVVSSSAGFNVVATDITATGFKVIVKYFGGGGPSPSSCTVDWLALE